MQCTDDDDQIYLELLSIMHNIKKAIQVLALATFNICDFLYQSRHLFLFFFIFGFLICNFLWATWAYIFSYFQ